jgi:NADH-quinone oxidoreductase subunit J
MSVEQIFYYLFALSACGGAVGVLLSQNVARMAFWLIVALGSTAGLYFLMNADFLAASQIIIYVGGTLVLLIFGIMLTASGPFVKIRSSPGEILMGAGIGLLLFALIAGSIASIDWQRAAEVAHGGEFTPHDGSGYNPAQQGNTARPLGFALLGMRPDQDLGQPEGSTLSTGYLFPFEIVSIHLLVVLVGAAYLARAKRRLPVNQNS